MVTKGEWIADRAALHAFEVATKNARNSRKLREFIDPSGRWQAASEFKMRYLRFRHVAERGEVVGAYYGDPAFTAKKLLLRLTCGGRPGPAGRRCVQPVLLELRRNVIGAQTALGSKSCISEDMDIE